MTVSQQPHRSLPAVEDLREHPMSAFFAGLRRRRQSRYGDARGARGKPRRRAVQTIVHNEAVLLPIWLRYYSRFFAPEDIYVLDHETDDGSTGGGGFQRIEVAHETIDYRWTAATLEASQHQLFERGYEVVLTVDVDEIVTTIPEWGGFADYLERVDEEFVNCLGYEILHMRDREPPLDPEQPLLEQRGHWFANDGYDKPALATAPTSWQPGLHSVADGRFNLDPDLRLIHVHRLDYEIARKRHELRARRASSAADLDQGLGRQNLLTDGSDFDRWFYGETCFEAQGITLAVERIPASWNGRF